MKYLISIILILLVVTAFTWQHKRQKNDIDNSKVTDEIVDNAGQTILSKKNYKEETDRIYIDVEYPELSNPNNLESINKINVDINEKFSRYEECEDLNSNAPLGIEYYLEIEDTYLSEKYLSVKYNVGFYCNYMPSMQSYDLGLTYDLMTGEKVSIDTLLNKFSKEELRQKIKNKIQETPLLEVDDECPEPEMSYEFFIDEEEIYFFEFYPIHYYNFCEVEIELNRDEM